MILKNEWLNLPVDVFVSKLNKIKSFVVAIRNPATRSYAEEQACCGIREHDCLSWIHVERLEVFLNQFILSQSIKLCLLEKHDYKYFLKSFYYLALRCFLSLPQDKVERKVPGR